MASASALIVVGLLGWRIQQHYLENRYVDSGIAEEALHQPSRDVTGADVDVLGTVETYAMFGPDLSNRVTVWNEHLDPARSPPARACRFWRTSLAPGAGFVTVSNAWLLREITPEDRRDWFTRDPSVVSIVDAGDLNVYFHDRALDPTLC